MVKKATAIDSMPAVQNVPKVGDVVHYFENCVGRLPHPWAAIVTACAPSGNECHVDLLVLSPHADPYRLSRIPHRDHWKKNPAVDLVGQGNKVEDASQTGHWDYRT